MTTMMTPMTYGMFSFQFVHNTCFRHNLQRLEQKHLLLENYQYFQLRPHMAIIMLQNIAGARLNINKSVI